MGQTQSGQLQLLQGVGAYVQINKDTITAGEFLQGSVFLKAQKPTQIDYIKLKFQCRESVSFVQISNQDSTSFNVQGTTYEHSFDIQALSKAEKLQGNKIFPFKILLPSELSGSIILTPENYLRYILSAETKISGQQSIVKSNEVIVHLTEPFRTQMQSISESVTNYPQCCDCCQSYGTVYTKLSCSKNLIQAGQEIKIIAQIDASHARVPIRSWKISLVKHIFKGSPEGQKEYIVSDNFSIGSFGSIQNGQKISESVTKTIPGTYSQQSTSYGTILGVYYTIDISSEMGLFSKGANISVPIFLISSNPNAQKNVKIKTQSFSSPTNYPLFKYTNMKSYVYRPVQGMPLINRKNFNPQNNLFTMNKTYFGQDSNVYQINKTKILTNNRSIEHSEQDPADPDTDGKAKWTNSKSERPRKYMDQQNQEDYGKFKDFESNDKI